MQPYGNLCLARTHLNRNRMKHTNKIELKSSNDVFFNSCGPVWASRIQENMCKIWANSETFGILKFMSVNRGFRDLWNPYNCPQNDALETWEAYH